jgi:indole-3-glycerol phosphate synthase
MILDDIIAYKKEELAETKRSTPIAEVKSQAADAGPTRGFGKTLSSGQDIRLIAEVKKASPSKGVIREDFDPVDIARTYARSGASCLSILTEQKYFQGKLEYLNAVRKAVELPLLRKDFIIDQYQIFEARAAGADAILLIAACLEKQQIEDYIGIAGELGLDVLVESHTYKELDRSLVSGAAIVGINNRDLHNARSLEGHPRGPDRSKREWDQDTRRCSEACGGRRGRDPRGREPHAGKGYQEESEGTLGKGMIYRRRR